MPLIKSISGIRGTIGGKVGENLTPVDIIKFTASFGKFIQTSNRETPRVIIGRDSRPSGEMVKQLVINTFIAMGVGVVDIGLAPTPTVQMAIMGSKAHGGIVISASHNGEEWNALKILNSKGEFLNKAEAAKLFAIAEKEDFIFSTTNKLGIVSEDDSWISKHIEKIIELPVVKPEEIRRARLKIAIDGINSVGGIAIPELLESLGVEVIYKLNCEPTGNFAHNPEPVAENIQDLAALVKEKQVDIGFAFDPDVDRVTMIDEKGNVVSEELTLVLAANYILQNQAGNTVSNLSSTRALKDITNKCGGKYFASPVGEINVVEEMKEHGAVVGGEGCGAVIYPDLHYGRDALIAVALILSYLSKTGNKTSQLLEKYRDYYMYKTKYQISSDIDLKKALIKLQNKYSDCEITTTDGIRIDFADKWVHLRKSNTEPIIRLIAESELSLDGAKKLSRTIYNDIKS